MKPAEPWPPHGQESWRWAQTHRGGTRDDRTLRSIVVSSAPLIANRAVALDSETAADLEAATSEIAKLDSSQADDLSALGTLSMHWAVTAPVILRPSWAPLCAPPGSPQPNRASPRNAFTKSPASGGN
jgi:hypothetical protein